MVILGLVQGLTEFLPVSSTAHLIFAETFLGIARPGILLEAILHLGTALAAIILFWGDVRLLLAGWWATTPLGRETDALRPYGRLAWLIVLITVITAAVGLALADPFERMFGSIRGTAVQLILTGVILLLARGRGSRARLDAGPGGAPAGGAGAGFFGLKDLPLGASLGYSPVQLFVGFGVSLVSGVLAICWLLAVVRRGRLAGFAVYCVAVGAAVWIVAGREEVVARRE